MDPIDMQHHCHGHSCYRSCSQPPQQTCSNNCPPNVLNSSEKEIQSDLLTCLQELKTIFFGLKSFMHDVSKALVTESRPKQRKSDNSKTKAESLNNLAPPYVSDHDTSFASVESLMEDDVPFDLNC